MNNKNILKIKDKLLNSSTNSLFFGISSNITASLVSNLARVAIIIIITRFYSKEEFGIWATITSTFAIIATGGDLGIVNALRNKLSELYVKGPESLKDAKSYFYTAFFIFIFLAIILSLIVTILYYNIPFESLFKTNNEYIKTQGKSILLWVQFLFLLGIPLSIGNASFFSFNESKYSALFTIIQSIVSLLFVLLASILHFSIVYISICYFLIILLTNLISLLYFIYRRNWYSWNDEQFEFKPFINRSKYLFSHGVKFLGLQFSKGFLENAGTVIASSMLGLNIAAEFNLVQKLYTFGMGIYQSAFNPLWGAFTINAAKNNWIWCKKTFFMTIKITSFIIPLITIIFYFYGNFFLSIIGGNTYKADSNLFLFLGISTFFYMLFTTVTTFQSAISKINFITLLMILFSLIILPITKPIITSYGVNGIAISLSIIWLISFLLGFLQSYCIIERKIQKTNTIN